VVNSDVSAGNYLGVWGSAADDVFVVGEGYNDLILHFDGTSWSPMAADSVWLFDVWGAAGGDVFAVGSDGAILHYTIPPFFADGFESGDVSGWSAPCKLET
jgi:hypothetical protein